VSRPRRRNENGLVLRGRFRGSGVGCNAGDTHVLLVFEKTVNDPAAQDATPVRIQALATDVVQTMVFVAARCELDFRTE
jgi:hypothetical protein